MLEDLTLHKALAMAVETEKQGAEYYMKLAKKFADNKEVAEVFTQLAKDEKLHEEQFRQMLKKVPEEPDTKEFTDKHKFLYAARLSEFFDTSTYKNIDDIQEPSDALMKALDFEKATLLYYQAISDIVGDSKEMNGLIQAEKQHAIALTKVLIADAKFRGMNDKWLI